jgi:hypothetical protein
MATERQDVDLCELLSANRSFPLRVFHHRYVLEAVRKRDTLNDSAIKRLLRFSQAMRWDAFV